jgi:hypothetical protein
MFDSEGELREWAEEKRLERAACRVDQPVTPEHLVELYWQGRLTLGD